MKKQIYDWLQQINPKNTQGVPKNSGNCQWCAIEAARVLLEETAPGVIPSFDDTKISSMEERLDPIEELVHPVHPSQFYDSAECLGRVMADLKTGELFLVSLENDDIDHAYLIYKDNDEELFLIDPDRNIIVEITNEDDFIQTVKGWDGIEALNYLNGEVFSPKTDQQERKESLANICLEGSVLSKNAIKMHPLPQYGSKNIELPEEKTSTEEDLGRVLRKG